MTTKFQITPNISGYSHADGMEVVATALDGGASRYRSDILNSTSRVTVKWTTDELGFEYIRAFFNTTIERGADAFTIDLLLDSPELTEHTVHFVPGSLKHELQDDAIFLVSAQLEVERNEQDDDYNGALVALVGSFGANEDLIETGLASLATLVNVDMPTTEPE